MQKAWGPGFECTSLSVAKNKKEMSHRPEVGGEQRTSPKGAKGQSDSRCSSEGCTNCVQKGGVCIRHGVLSTAQNDAFHGQKRMTSPVSLTRSWVHFS